MKATTIRPDVDIQYRIEAADDDTPLRVVLERQVYEPLAGTSYQTFHCISDELKDMAEEFFMGESKDKLPITWEVIAARVLAQILAGRFDMFFRDRLDEMLTTNHARLNTILAFHAGTIARHPDFQEALLRESMK